MNKKASNLKVTIKRGMVVTSEFGTGPVVAITKDWLIHDCGDGHEAALCIDDQEFWVPSEVEGVDLPDEEREIEVDRC